MSKSNFLIQTEIETKQNLIKLIEENYNKKINLSIDRGVVYGFELAEVCSEEQMKKITDVIIEALKNKIAQLKTKLQNLE